MSVFLVPAYRPVIRRTQIITRTVRSWPEGASQWLQDCFETTDWTIFSHQDLEVFTSAVLGYIQYCVNTATVDRQIRLFPNGKPCMNSEVRRLLWERNEAFRFGDREHFSAARAALKRGIWEAKMTYKAKIEEEFSSNNSRQVWQGLRHITNQGSRNTAAICGDASLAEELNSFFATLRWSQHWGTT